MPLNVIGLISGGKDSLFSLAHCIKNGHNVVALGNLYPHKEGDAGGIDEGSDLNSFMYQTVGHTIIPLYAKALGVPLYRRAIIGTVRQTGRYYDTSNTTTAPDETEDMYLLIQDVLKHHPEANAVNAGAILSTYQRSRVESVAIRLGLTPLAYLWQYPALPAPDSRQDSLTGLLDDMSAAQCDARIIKIASGGIRNNLLSTDVAAPTVGARLVSGLAPFFPDAGQEFSLRGAVLGEGGEYETLALDGPSPLWKKRIEVEFLDPFEAEGGTTYATFGKTVALDKDESKHTIVPIPHLLDKRFAAVQARLHNTSQGSGINVSKNVTTSTASLSDAGLSPFHFSSHTLQLSKLTFPEPGLTPAQQLERIIDTTTLVVNNYRQNLNLSSLTLRNIVSTTLLLRSIDNFTTINQIYAAKLWPQGLPNPPSRVTIAAPLPEGTHVSLSLIIDLNEFEAESRKGLHVQSQSYWAPANIGPYSQAISTPVLSPQEGAVDDQDGADRAKIRSLIEVVHMAGQIPLVPASMAMLDRSFSEQAVLALQHLWRVGQERSVESWAGAGVAYLAHIDNNVTPVDKDAVMLDRVHKAARVWKLAHQIDERGVNCGNHAISDQLAAEADVADEDEDEAVDIWDLQQQNRGFGASAIVNITVGEHLHVLPNRDLFKHRRATLPGNIKITTTDHAIIPPFIAAEVSGLPRNAPIEWWSTGIAGLAKHAGKQWCRTWPLSQDVGTAASLSGIAIEHIGQEAGEDEHDMESPAHSRDQSSFTLFVTLTMKMKVEDPEMNGLLKTVDDLKTTLFEEDASMTCEIVTAHSFVNLSCSPDSRALLEKTQLVQRATLVPCYHVWTSRQTPGSGASEEQDEDTIEEVAAALILRIDAYSQ